MMARIKAWIARHWPLLRLRTILFGTLLLVAALPGFGALFLRVYENALVRRTEADLIAQATALAATAAVLNDGDEAAGAMPMRAAPIDLATLSIHAPVAIGADRVAIADPSAARLAQHMTPILQATATGTGASILLLDRQGVALTGPHRGRRLKAWVEIDAALRGASMTLLRDDGEPGWRYPVRWISPVAHSRLYHARPIQNGGAVTGVLLLTRPPMTLLDGIMEDGGKIMAGVATIFVLLLLLSAVLSRAIVRPIEGLSRATRHLASGRHAHPRPPALHVVEIQALYRDFGRMAAAIEARSRYLRDFAAAVSHEFKTPLAAITGAIELLQDHGDMRPDERARFLENMRADAERLSRLVRKLMELARADVLVGNRHARTDPTPLLSAIADALGTASFRVDVAQGGAAPAMAIDRDVLEAVLTTIVENARQAGAARMSIRLGHDGDAVMIDLVDDGPGVPDGDRDRIFHPFFTSKRAMGGTGLGLAIARSLLEAYDGSLLLIPAAKGAHFRLICAAAGKNSGHSVFFAKRALTDSSSGRRGRFPTR